MGGHCPGNYDVNGIWSCKDKVGEVEQEESSIGLLDLSFNIIVILVEGGLRFSHSSST